MSQLFPVKVKHTIPSPFPSADIKEFAIGEDGMDYAVKSGQIAACEALCYKAFAACSIAVPQNAILEMLDGSEAFGSRIIIDKTFDVASPAEKLQWFRDCSAIMSSICGLDHMLANEDRHQGNFLYLTGLNGRKTCMAIDFSRALLFRGMPTNEIWASTPNNTTNMVIAKKNICTWDVAAATHALLTLSSINKTTWESWVADLPKDWLDAHTRNQLTEWWNSGEFQSRLQKCMIAIQ